MTKLKQNSKTLFVEKKKNLITYYVLVPVGDGKVGIFLPCCVDLIIHDACNNSIVYMCFYTVINVHRVALPLPKGYNMQIFSNLFRAVKL